MRVYRPLFLAVAVSCMSACVSRIDDEQKDAQASDDAGADSSVLQMHEQDSGVRRCDYDVDCSDHLWCNGVERCDPGSKDADARGCRSGDAPNCDDGIACTMDRCVEQKRACEWVPADLDGDDDPDARCLDDKGKPLGRDCNDDDDHVNVFATETCDGIDDDCDGNVDENVSVLGYVDRDGDQHGKSGSKQVSYCFGTPGFSVTDDDCRDDLSDTFKGHLELCDEQDNDCDEKVDETCSN